MNDRKNQFGLALGALGIVFGDIGTSPLYALSEIFFSHDAAIAPTSVAVLGVTSLIFWVITLVISLKYLLFVLRADNDREGGVFALYGLIYPFRRQKKSAAVLLTLLLLGAGFLFGDGMITPAISVLSAVEGLHFTFPELSQFILPLTSVILSLLFLIQRVGTHAVGKFFGPILLVWFLALGLIGINQILITPEIIQAINPIFAVRYIADCNLKALAIVFGGAVLVITGGEALFADMGHFSVRAIRQSWFFVVFPSLLLNYFGQGAFLLRTGRVEHANVFYSIVPEPFRFAMLLLATLATIIASQALITGVYSLATQAVALGLFPRLKIRYTHDKHVGQVYVPIVNWVLLFGCLCLVFIFGESQKMASAYGFAVSVDMLLTSAALLFLAHHYWRWSLAKSCAIFGFFAFVDLVFLTSNSIKFFAGGYIPFAIGVLLFIVMSTWRWGRKATYRAYSSVETPKIKHFIELHRQQKTFLQKNLLLLVPKPINDVEKNTPALLKMIIDRYGILAANIFFVEILHKKVPYLDDDRCAVTVFEKNQNGMIASVAIQFGFMEDPNVENALEVLAKHHQIQLDPDPHHWVFHVSMELLKPSGRQGLFKHLRNALYTLLRQLSRPAYVYYGIGDEIQLSIQIIPVKI